MSGVTINGSTTGYTVVKAGLTFNTYSVLNYQQFQSCACTGCIVQGYVGLMPGPAPAAAQAGRAGCGTGLDYQGCDVSITNGNNPQSFVFTAPSAPGTYYYNFGTTLDYQCQPWGCAGAGGNLFAVCVIP
jgi:hypothetical protein